MSQRTRILGTTLLALWYLGIAVMLAAALWQQAHADIRIPELGWQLRHTLESELERRWGVRADRFLSLSAGQIHQESHWRPDAESPYAQGLTQFTPSTAAWIAEQFRAELWPADPWDPYWAIRAMVLYDARLLERIDEPATDCDAWAMTLAAYNGGIGWIRRDRRLCRLAGNCHPGRWFAHTERFSHRARWAFVENRSYPRRILLTLTPAYLDAGWAGVDLCGGRTTVVLETTDG